jgi:hypothetical protein
MAGYLPYYFFSDRVYIQIDVIPACLVAPGDSPRRESFQERRILDKPE